mgnify:CR=1 FL=1
MIDKYGDAGRVRFGLKGAFNVALAKMEVKDLKMREYLRQYFEYYFMFKELKILFVY